MNALHKLYIETVGCQMNVLDSEMVVASLRKRGFDLANDLETADVILFNTCSVREQAENKTYSALGRLRSFKERHPEKIIGVMGCMAQNHKELIFERAPHVDLVVGTYRFEDVADLLDEVRHGQRILAVDEKELTFERDLSARPRRHQAFVTVVRGCNKFCTFCIVPFTQGRERSRPIDEVVDEAQRLADDGVVEITLLGQRIDTYGLDLRDGSTLAALLRRIHEEVPGLARIGFVTSHPNHMTEELARTIGALPRISRYLHVPVQSGSDAVLARMNRGYTRAEYVAAIDRMRRNVPGLSLATDWIVGFPGETAADFEASCALLRELDYQNSFVFKYSPREGTRAFDWGDDVPREEKERRNHVLLDLQREISLRRNRARVGEVVTVLVEGISKLDDTKWTGRTHDNLIVHFPAGRDLTGRLAPVRLTGCTALCLSGDLA
jgi:tRNA-2-methylthio-N6-dimethylallyladenosine synthase